MTRFILPTAALILAAPFVIGAQSASAATTPMKPMMHKPMHHMAGKPMGKMATRDSGAAAVDALNDQALARAKGGQ